MTTNEEAIFEECAEIAMEHIMGDIIADRPGYDEACREVAEAIRLRASNRKIMDAVAAQAREDTLARIRALILTDEKGT